jgi:hypothetical protein
MAPASGYHTARLAFQSASVLIESGLPRAAAARELSMRKQHAVVLWEQERSRLRTLIGQGEYVGPRPHPAQGRPG